MAPVTRLSWDDRLPRLKLFLSAYDNQMAPAAGTPPPAVFQLTTRKMLGNCVHIYKDRGMTMNTLSSLTPREVEILQLVVAGYTSKAIAAEICISEKTVEFHLNNIYTKIGVRTRLMAGLWAIQQGIVETREIPSSVE